MSTATATAPSKPTSSDIAKLKAGHERLVQELLDEQDYDGDRFRQLQDHVIKVVDTLRRVLGPAAWAEYQQERWRANERRHGRPVPARTASRSLATPARSQTRPATSTRPAPTQRRPEYDVELVKKRSTRTVQISRRALDAIWDECDRYDWRVETGGGLYAFNDRSWSWDRELRVIEANTAAVERSYAAVTLSGTAMREESEMLTRYWGGDRVRVLGDWHAQPEGDTEPSLPDLQGWAHGLAKTDQGVYIGVIATERSISDRSRKPMLHAWVVRRHDYVRNKIVVEPADVVFRP
jgi:hypothetical protein